MKHYPSELYKKCPIFPRGGESQSGISSLRGLPRRFGGGLRIG